MTRLFHVSYDGHSPLGFLLIAALDLKKKGFLGGSRLGKGDADYLFMAVALENNSYVTLI